MSITAINQDGETAGGEGLDMISLCCQSRRDDCLYESSMHKRDICLGINDVFPKKQK